MFFVTGTDTDSGKTAITAALLHKARTSYGMRTLGLKPVASGCDQTEDGLRNSDALLLKSESSLQLDYQAINPFSFEPAIAPHIAAADLGVDISPETIVASLDFTQFSMANFCLMEGAGGWRLPLGDNRFLSEVATALAVPVIIVVNMRLGALNHALLTRDAIIADGLEVAGWVANNVEQPMQRYQENLSSLKEMMQAPLLGEVPHLAQFSAAAAAQHLDITPLLKKRY
ncbi:dethiobiotin synthase [Shewanella avicenniae]|uniref:ATP-dependent dethiobiotin synthetase BioD n=1 Tax=Shewanella avicenniae TaxID=2814294 RepID=A0ABX7QW52_9GAMM|nr:dethiobiotin synthase [Shewanella avicenniae]QSX35494.1 dethiobiotin synthase [Shewanella avicenniae]